MNGGNIVTSKPLHSDEGKRERCHHLSCELAQEKKLDLGLTVPDREEESGHYRLPLGKTDTYPLDEKRPEGAAGEHILISVQLRRYVFAEATGGKTQPEPITKVTRDRQKCVYEDELRPGWVYIFVEGHLWREYQVGPLRCLADVNLNLYKGLDVRPAQCLSCPMATMPLRIRFQDKKIEIAYSDVQWPWAYINHFGGMAQDDPRLHTPAKEGADIHATLQGITVPLPDRSVRFQDVTKTLNTWHSLPVEPAEVNPQCSTPPLVIPMHIRDHGIVPDLYLHDPLDIADKMMGDVDTVQHDLVRSRAHAHADSLYLMANITQQLVVAKKKYGKYVDMGLVKEVLCEQQTREILNRLNATVSTLGDYLTIMPFASSAAGLAVATVMCDYWVQSRGAYLLGLQRSAMMFGCLQNLPGLPYLQKLFREKSPITAGTFSPNKAQLEIIAATGLESVSGVLQDLAGLRSINETVEQVLLKYCRQLVTVASKGDLKLSSYQVEWGEYLLETRKIVSAGEDGETMAPPEDLRKVYSELTEVYAGTDERALKVQGSIWAITESQADYSRVTLPKNHFIAILSRNRLHINRIVPGFFAVIDVFNLLGCIRMFYDTHNKAKNAAGIVGNFAKAISCLFQIVKDNSHAKLEGRGFNFGERGGSAGRQVQTAEDSPAPEPGELIAAELNAAESDAVLGELSTAERSLLNNLSDAIKFTYGFGVLGGAIGIVTGMEQSWQTFRRGSDELAAVSALNVLADTMTVGAFAITGLLDSQEAWMGARITEIRMVSAVLKWGSVKVTFGFMGIEGLELITLLSWFGLAVSMVLLVVEYMLYKTPLEQWLFHGPFGKKPGKRFLSSEDGGKASWASWKNPHKAQDALLNMLYGFSGSGSFSRSWVQSGFWKGLGDALTDRRRPLLSMGFTLTFSLFIEGESRLYWCAKTQAGAGVSFKQATLEAGPQLSRNEDGLYQIYFQCGPYLNGYEFSCLLDVFGDGTLLIPGIWQKGTGMGNPGVFRYTFDELDAAGAVVHDMGYAP